MAAPVPHSHSGQSGGLTAPRTLVFAVIALFFIWGGLTSLNDILIPKLKGLLCAACGGRRRKLAQIRVAQSLRSYGA